MARTTSGARGRGNQKIGPSHAIRDIVIAAMNKGQLLPLGMLGVILLALYRMPAEDVSSLMFGLVDGTASGLLGWIVAVLSLMGWYAHARFQRRTHADEMKRVGDEKKALHEQLLGDKAVSSKDKK